MRPLGNRTRIAIGIAMIVGSASLSASPLFIENPREAMPEFVMPVNQTVPNDGAIIRDTDPRSRTVLVQKIRAHAGFEWENLNTANRFHTFYDKGVASLDKRSEKALETSLEASKGKESVIVMGFADDEGDYEANKTLSAKRATVVAEKLKTLNKDLHITVLSSVLWPGDPARARRVDVLYY